MRVMLDTNVIISYILFKSELMEKFYNYLLNNEDMIISNVIVKELKEVFNKKFKSKIEILNTFLKSLNVECINIDKIDDFNLFKIRDDSDYPVLYSAIKGNVDIFITGDEDFKDISIDKPIIMSVREYIKQYVTFGG